MSDIVTVNPKVVDELTSVARLVTDPKSARQQGVNAAYQAVAHATAIAIQDSAEYMRSVSTIATTVIGAAMSKLIETKDPTYSDIIKTAQKSVDAAARNFQNIGASASAVASMYPMPDDTADDPEST